MTEDQLEAAFRDLGAHVDVPPTPDVTAAVRRQIQQRPRRVVLRPVLATVLALLIALALAFAVSPEVRAGVARFLEFAGVAFSSDPPPPTLPTPTVQGERVVTLDEAKKIAPFAIHVLPKLGEPREVRVTDQVVSLIYDNYRLDEFDGSFGPAVGKFASATDIEKLTINGDAGLWIPRPHDVLYIDRNGRWREESARLSGRTLIWQAGPLTLRLEGDFTRDEAVAIASGD